MRGLLEKETSPAKLGIKRHGRHQKSSLWFGKLQHYFSAQVVSNITNVPVAIPWEMR
jgi:hypothetical protein